MQRHIICLILTFCAATSALAENIYEIRKITESEWLAMSTEERLRALSSSRMHERNQTFLGYFGRHQDLYSKWGYEFYEMEDRYENYAFRGFEAYNLIEERRRKWSYNEFGDRIAKMRLTNARMWREIYRGDGTYEVHMPYNYINSAGVETGYIDGVWVAREGTDDWAISVIGAGALRTKFTPLTMSIPNLNGISIDLQSKNTSGKFVSSVMVGPAAAYGGHITSLTGRGVMLRGGHVRRRFGVMTLGATLSTVYGVQANRERGREWRGTVTTEAPTPLMVALRFLDDSPEDGEGGPIVYEVRLKVNNRFRDDIIPQIIKDDVTRDRTTAITDKLDSGYLEPSSTVYYGAPKYDYNNTTSNLLKYTDYFFMNELLRGENSDTIISKYSKSLNDSFYELLEQGGKALNVNGTETLTYIFDLASITDNVNRVEAVVTVANDYHIQTAHVYTVESRGGHDPTGKPKSWYNSTYWNTVAQCEGNIKDGSNVRTITLDFGLQVAKVIYGFDVDIDYRGLKIRGEYVTDKSAYMYPDGKPGSGRPENVISGMSPRTGHRWSLSDNAYYLTMQKNWRHVSFSGEVFKMGKLYKPWFDYFALFDNGSIHTRNNTARVYLIEDNDDDDMYPDTMLIQRNMGFRIQDSEDPDGVFPGNDADNDGIADNNKNNNNIPDYNEPFLMFDVDPDEFVFGNDYNNNTIPDFREDDLKPDTPYDLDRQGRHFYVGFSPLERVNFIVGSMRTHGVATTNRTNNDYFKLLVDYNYFDVGKLYAEYRYEKIQDNIRDPYIQVNTRMEENYVMPGVTSTLGRFDRDLFYDELEYRNSTVNRIFLDSVIRAIPSITLENHVKFERNDQIEGNMYDMTYQPHDVLNTMGLINKIVYTKQFGNWVFSPGVKYRMYKKARSESVQPLEHYMMRIPLVMFKYMLSQRTDISLGMQGIPGFDLKYNDYIQEHNDYSQRTYTIQLQNRTGYFGYNIWGSLGFSYEHVRYDEPYRQFEEYKTTTTFLKIFLGW